MLTTYQQQAKAKLALTILAIIVVAGIVVLADHIKAGDMDDAVPASHTAQTTTPVATATATTNATTSPSTTSTSATATDGTYSASSTYYVPPGTEDIQVTVTLKSGVVTNVSIQNSENNHDSAIFQREFTAEYKAAVVGKKISGLRIGTIAGASDTSQGFNDALSQIAAKAQA